MHNSARTRPAIGILSTWSIYEGATIDQYAHTLLQGMCAAARDQDSHLLLGCGIGRPSSPRQSRTAWPVPLPGADFIPVGDWNTDGLIVIPDDLSPAQLQYVQALIRSGFPVISTTLELPGPFVAVDNAGGICQALTHLLEHGHRRIAFVAGKFGRAGDSAERLAAYCQWLQDAGIAADPRLIEYGEHHRSGGRAAMERILATQAPFTAVLASNDLSCLGAIDALVAAGRCIAEDVAVIGFDDILDTRSQLPPLTSVRHPTFALGYQSVLFLLDRLAGKQADVAGARVPTRLVIRQSCGCRMESARLIAHAGAPLPDLAATQATLARALAEATWTQAHHSSLEQLDSMSSALVHAFAQSLIRDDPALFASELRQLGQWIDAQNEDAAAWHAAISALRQGLPDLLAGIPHARPGLANTMIDNARMEIGGHVQRQATRALLQHMDMANRLGLMTAQLLTALDATASAAILERHLPQLGIQHAVVVAYAASFDQIPAEDDDPLAQGVVVLSVGLMAPQIGRRLAVRQFPPADLYPSASAVQLAVLPLVIDEQLTGFVAFSATNLEPCAAIVHNLAAALRTGRLYLAAIEGRKLAEAANQLKSRFLSMVSHELRTPLSLIVGLSEMSLREHHAHSSSAAFHDIEQIHASARHLSRLIGDVLDLASGEAGQLHLMREPLNLIEVLHVVATIGEQMARAAGLEWRARLPDGELWVFGDRTRLRQIALNLIGNAVKFTSAGSVALEVLPTEHQALILVSDTGIGVPPDEHDLIFQEFQRSEQVIQSGYSGLGLGLAICKQLVAAHGGTLSLRSPGDLGCGTTFYVRLPRLLDAPAPLAPPILPAIHEAAEVLVLAERAEAADRLCADLRERGFTVRQCLAYDTAVWLPQLLAAPALAVMLDEELAAREGWAIAGLLKRHPATEHIPVLIYALDPERNQGELLELNYFHKPIRPDQLAHALAQHAAPESARADRPAVLVVDDDAGILGLHCRLLEQAGYRALRAGSGRAALAVLEHSQPSLILLDLMMPGMDGFAVLDALRANPATRDIPVIVVTAQMLTEADIERCNRGVAAVLSKGLFSAAETLNHIEATLAKHRTLGGPTQRLVRRAMAFIHAHYAEALDREQIAGHVGMSADYLTDCFRQELGVTPIAYLNRYRMRRACVLLETTDMPITQIALAVGSGGSAHFTRLFQREIGVSPSAYRRGQRGRPAAAAQVPGSCD